VSLSLPGWQQRYRQQAGWTRALRHYIYTQINLSITQRILDVGCGTGALLEELCGEMHLPGVVGLDIQPESLALAQRAAPQAGLTAGDALALPFPDGAFEVCLCHYVLLWLPDPLQALQEMRRVIRPGGWALALAEPDYGGRVDYPPELEQLGDWQRQSLREQGADPLAGRKLAGWMQAAGFTRVQCGVLGGQWQTGFNPETWQTEWAVLADDLAQLQRPPPPGEIARLQALDWQASQRGERILYVPTFYAWGVA
jgi:ubiquinone/menaquinone biosynthesis C-methylase UbiE